MITTLFWGSVVPALFAGTFILVAGFMPALISGPLRRAAFPIGFAVGFYLLNSLPNWPPTGSTSSLFFVALLCFVWSFIDRLGGRFSQVLRVALIAIVIFMILKPLLLEERLGGDIPGVTGRLELAIHMLMLIVLAQFVWWFFARGVLTVSIPVLALIPILVMTGLSFASLFSGSALIAQLAGTYCAVHTALFVLGLVSPKFFKFDDHLIFSSIMMFCFALIGFYFLDVNLIPLALILSPLLLLVLWPYLPMKPVTAMGQMLTVSVISAIPIGIAVYPLYKAYSSY